ncbi:uncharacterized protein LOC123499927 [Portunus trituberculatus]|uniref:uncharacterized protein LOC123499927 n=1 Tax=Portunus trituberculatus TaxID=210409 RepID=UPI001E1CC8DA|nr:uncharacterized protein LOC123499927 [Portunus trituberculatus]
MCEDTQLNTEQLDLMVTSTGMRKSRTVLIPQVIVVTEFPSSLKGSVARSSDMEVWSHLRDIAQFHAPKEVELLIGLDIPQALVPLEVRSGKDGEPFATRTLLGWTINGPMGLDGHDVTTVNSHITTTIAENQRKHLDHQVNLLWELNATNNNCDDPISVEDKRVTKLWSENVVQVDGHYQLPIPFRNKSPDLPDNKELAERRLASLRRRLVKHPELFIRYQEEMSRLLSEGHAERVPSHNLNTTPGKTWYLPHHPVLNPKKPEKMRIVFDCAATYKTLSLNSQVMQGPDLNNNLMGVLLRFRQERVAIMADIEAMFHQVLVTPEHRDALRFLWWNNEHMSGPPATYRMKVHLFGGVWSPSCAAFALQRTFQDHGKYLHEEIQKASRNFYVDDLLHSVESPGKATIVIHRLRKLLNKGGFRLTKWSCNQKRVLKEVPQSEQAMGVKEILLGDKLPTERALGILWDLEEDELAVQVQIPKKPETKRGLLSMISSIYDPLGFFCP